jgi:hypothetical protein
MTEKIVEALEIEGKHHQVHWYDDERTAGRSARTAATPGSAASTSCGAICSIRWTRTE